MVLGLVLASMLSVSSVAVSFLLLDASGPIILPLIFSVMIPFINYVKIRWLQKRWQKISIALSSLYFTLVFLNIIIIPVSAYEVWFALANDLQMFGSISFAFVLITNYLIIQASSFLIDTNLQKQQIIKTSLSVLVSCTLLTFIVFREELSLILFMISALMFMVYTKPFFTKPSPKIPIIILLTISLGLSSFLYEVEKRPTGNPLVSLASYLTRETIIEFFPEFPLQFDVPGYGYGFESSDPAESPILSPNTIFYLEGRPGKTVYLRTEVFRQFLQGQWIQQGGIDPLDLLEGNDTFVDQDQITLELIGDFYNAIPHTLKSTQLSYKSINYMLDGPKDTALIPSFPLIRGDRVFLYETNLSGDVPIDPELWTQIEPRYRDELQGLAQSLVASDDLGTLQNIQNYLRRNFTYSLDTEGSSDFMLKFLNDTQKGFCFHFASSFVILARLSGIPARYVTGFLVKIPSAQEELIFDSNTGAVEARALVSGLNAHAWPEVYLDARGWMSFEATPPMIDLENQESNYSVDNDDAQTREQLSVFIPSTPTSSDQSHLIQWERILSISLGLLILIFLILLVTRRKRKIQTNPLIEGLRNLVYLFKSVGVETPSDIGWEEWIKLASKKLNEVNLSRPALFGMILDSIYGSRNFQKRDIKYIHLLNSALTRRLKKH
jgi:transglutaminase-like putative cysteine protease